MQPGHPWAWAVWRLEEAQERLCPDHLPFCDAVRDCCPKIHLCLRGSCRLISAAGNLPRLSSALRSAAAGGCQQASVSRSRGSSQWHHPSPNMEPNGNWCHSHRSQYFCQNKSETCLKVVNTHRGVTLTTRDQCWYYPGPPIDTDEQGDYIEEVPMLPGARTPVLPWGPPIKHVSFAVSQTQIQLPQLLVSCVTLGRFSFL